MPYTFPLFSIIFLTFPHFTQFFSFSPVFPALSHFFQKYLHSIFWLSINSSRSIISISVNYVWCTCLSIRMVRRSIAFCHSPLHSSNKELPKLCMHVVGCIMGTVLWPTSLIVGNFVCRTSEDLLSCTAAAAADALAIQKYKEKVSNSQVNGLWPTGLYTCRRARQRRLMIKLWSLLFRENWHGYLPSGRNNPKISENFVITDGNVSHGGCLESIWSRRCVYCSAR